MIAGSEAPARRSIIDGKIGKMKPVPSATTKTAKNRVAKTRLCFRDHSELDPSRGRSLTWLTLSLTAKRFGVPVQSGNNWERAKTHINRYGDHSRAGQQQYDNERRPPRGTKHNHHRENKYQHRRQIHPSQAVGPSSISVLRHGFPCRGALQWLCNHLKSSLVTSGETLARLRSAELTITDSELNAIAAAAMIGLSSPSAAMGMPIAL